MFRSFLLAGLGGAAGSIARYAISILLPRTSPASFPFSTMLVNIIGCFIIGILTGMVLRSDWMAHTGWALLATGVCGGFTTFSSFSNESIQLIKTGNNLYAFVYLAGSLALGLLATLAGLFIVQAISRL